MDRSYSKLCEGESMLNGSEIKENEIYQIVFLPEHHAQSLIYSVITPREFNENYIDFRLISGKWGSGGNTVHINYDNINKERVQIIKVSK